MNVLGIEPYYGGSHRSFLDSLVDRSIHRWNLATLPARHWKWRMRSSPSVMIDIVAAEYAAGGNPDVILASEMLDLPSFLGLATRHPRFSDWISDVPIALYFHENQWVYPTSPQSQVDHHYAFTNLLSAAAATSCWFNSEFNRRTFLQSSKTFLGRMPDCRRAIDLDLIETNSHVIPPGFQPPGVASSEASTGHVLQIGWVGRFEHDKRPDRFFQLLKQLAESRVSFELILLGQRGIQNEWIKQIEQRFSAQIRFNGFAQSRNEYEQWLGKIDVVVSTADHEFFGIAICESIWAGAVPVTPDALSYCEYVPDGLRYSDLDTATAIIAQCCDVAFRKNARRDSRQRIAHYRIEEVVPRFDAALSELAGT